MTATESGGQGISVPKAEMGIPDGSSPEYALSWEGATSRRTFLVDGADLVQAVGEAMGFSWISPSGKLRRWLPEYDPNLPWLVCKKLVGHRGVRYTGHEDPGTGWGEVNKFKKAQLTFEYGFRNFDEFSDDEIDAEPYNGNEFYRFTSFTMTPAADYLTLPAGALYWSPEVVGPPAREVVPFATGRVQYQATVVYKWHQIPFSAYTPGSVLDTTFQSLTGRLNDATFDGFPANSLLLESVQPEQVRGPTGEFYWNFEYNMKFLSGDMVSHNHLLRRVPGATVADTTFVPTQVTTDGVFYAPGSLPQPASAGGDGQRTLYLEADFNRLWRVDV